jgi:hypothetical protein
MLQIELPLLLAVHFGVEGWEKEESEDYENHYQFDDNNHPQFLPQWGHIFKTVDVEE